ncbi:MAG TPA: DUF2997 domain-containing protein [Treponemataceae bacterium]|nr:MAG: hypothetical protein BWY20_01981 [Spirochaetes bacterium ADurb.Bin215]HPA11173.1 DUF2997 domain-containing protein [Treponemataceae bacterium]
MSGKQELEITISNDGEVSINVHGAKGSSCLDLTKEIEESIGVVTEREKKSSFYESNDAEHVRITSED